MTIRQSVLDAIIALEEAVQSRWISRALILCPNEYECTTASDILSSLNYIVETVLLDDVHDTERYNNSIGRLRNSLSKVLVTTEKVLKMIQIKETEPLKFDIVL